MKLIVSKSDTVEIVVYCYELDGDVEATHIKIEVPESVNSVEMVNFTFRQPSHSDSTEIFTQCGFKPSDSGNAEFDLSALQGSILKILLSGWDIKNENDKKIPFTTGNIDALHPSVARAAVAGCLEKIKL